MEALIERKIGHVTFLLTIPENIRIHFLVNWFKRSFVCGANVVKLGSEIICFPFLLIFLFFSIYLFLDLKIRIFVFNVCMDRYGRLEFAM
jgi:hypothetical protein